MVGAADRAQLIDDVVLDRNRHSKPPSVTESKNCLRLARCLARTPRRTRRTAAHSTASAPAAPRVIARRRTSGFDARRDAEPRLRASPKRRSDDSTPARVPEPAAQRPPGHRDPVTVTATAFRPNRRSIAEAAAALLSLADDHVPRRRRAGNPRKARPGTRTSDARTHPGKAPPGPNHSLSPLSRPDRLPRADRGRGASASEFQ